MMVSSSKVVWGRWRGVRRFKIYLGSKIYKNGNTLGMGVEENEDVKGYSWDGEPFQIS